MSDEYLNDKKVFDIMNLVKKQVLLITSDKSINELLELLTENPEIHNVYVVDDKERLIGSIRLNSLIEYIYPTAVLSDIMDFAMKYDVLSKYQSSTVKEIMDKNPYYVYDTTPISDMIRIMQSNKVNELPIIDKNRKITGEVNLLELICFHLQMERANIKQLV